MTARILPMMLPGLYGMGLLYPPILPGMLYPPILPYAGIVKRDVDGDDGDGDDGDDFDDAVVAAQNAQVQAMALAQADAMGQAVRQIREYYGVVPVVNEG
jgi:hypothetical protein